MKHTDLTEYGLIYKKTTKPLQNRGILDSDLLDLPSEVVNKFNLNYCNCGVSLCLYEQFAETPSFYSFLLVKERGVFQDADVQKHESIYKSENDKPWKILANREGREIKEFISFDETCETAFNQFIRFIYTCLKVDKTIYYWIKFDETGQDIPLIKEKLKGYGINAISMSNNANILILIEAQDTVLSDLKSDSRNLKKRKSDMGI